MENQWIINIVAGLVVGILLPVIFFIGALCFRRVRPKVTRLLLRLVGAGIREYFPTQKAATKEIGKAFQEAREIRILAVRAWSIFPVVHDLSLLGDEIRQKGKDCTIRILLLNPFEEGGSGRIAFITQRAAEIEDIYQREAIALRQQVAMTIDVLRSLKNEGFKCEVRMYNELPVFKLLIFDDNAFIGGFKKASVGRNNPLYHVCRNEGLLFELADRYFNYIWEHRSSECNMEQSAVERLRKGKKT